MIEILNADMREYTSFKAGGKADRLVIPSNKEELKEILKELKTNRENFIILGNGSNILVRDGGYKGTIIKIGDSFNEILVENNSLRIGGGALMSAIARKALREELTGFEFASGIPGSIGGAVFMNAGAYGGEIKNILKEVTVVTANGEDEKVLSKEDLNLRYRNSVLQETGDIVVEVVLNLEKGDKEKISTEMKELLERRNSKQPVSYPSAGSFFKRPEGHYAGKLIQDSQLKGLTVGGAQVSNLHAGFIINTGSATATDIIQLMHLIQASVMKDSGVKMKPEVRIIGED